MQLEESKLVRTCLVSIAVITLFFIIVIPIFFILYQALSEGFNLFWRSITETETLHAIGLTLFVTLIVVCLNLLFGLSISWALGKFSVKGSRIIIGLIEIPLSISPVIAGLIFILFLGKYSLVGGWLDRHGIEVIYAVPGVVIATLFVTMPYVAREVIPLIQEMGSDEEEAAILLGAKGFRTFFYVTLPKIKWAVIYGLLITTARAMGEFGAVSVVSGHLRNKTMTLTLQIEALYNEYNFTRSFAVASLLTLLAVVTLLIKSWVEWKKKES